MLLAGVAVILLLCRNTTGSGALLAGSAQVAAGVVAGFAIGVFAALLGVAGGELLIPTLVLLFGSDIKHCREPVTRGEPADNACGVRPL